VASSSTTINAQGWSCNAESVHYNGSPVDVSSCEELEKGAYKVVDAVLYVNASVDIREK